MKTLNALNLAQAQSEVPWPIDFVKMTFDDDNTADSILRLCNHHHDIVFSENGSDETYVATGQFLGFGDISDELEIKNNSLDISLSGVGGTFTSVFVQNNVEGSLVEVSRGYYDESTGNIVAPPEPRWAGRVNNASIQDDYNFTDEDRIIISVQCKSLFESLFKRQSGRYTSLQGFQKFNSGDRSMEFMASIALFTPSFGKED